MLTPMYLVAIAGSFPFSWRAETGWPKHRWPPVIESYGRKLTNENGSLADLLDYSRPMVTVRKNGR